jgi:uncharacterized sulfatase
MNAAGLRLLRWLPGLIIAWLGLAAWPLSVATGAARPNIVFILADDLGWRGLRCAGHEIHDTPHLDRRAREGTRFTRGFAGPPICSASRAALRTGRSPARLGFESGTKLPTATRPAGQALVGPPYPLNLPLAEVTLGEVLGGASYATGYFGKWHVSAHSGGYLGWSATHGPLQQGYAEGDADFGNHPYAYRERPARRTAPLAAGDYGGDRERVFVWPFPYDHPETGYDEAKPTIGVNDFAVSQTRPHSALRTGAGKLLRFHEDDRVELDNLAADAGEQEDLSAREPGRTKALRARLEGELRAMGAQFPSAAGSLP